MSQRVQPINYDEVEAAKALLRVEAKREALALMHTCQATSTFYMHGEGGGMSSVEVRIFPDGTWKWADES
jgi:hypothetical protein